jgi:hypothetical protein
VTLPERLEKEAAEHQTVHEDDRRRKALFAEAAAALRQVLAKDAKDSARYRWLRNEDRGVYWTHDAHGETPWLLNGQWGHTSDLDAAIDAALPEPEKGTE